MRAILMWCLVAAAMGVDNEAAHARAVDLMSSLPELPPFAAVPIEPLSGDTPMIDGVLITPGQRVVLEGVSLFAQGPVDGLEVLCCLQGGKNHESFARLLTGNAKLVKAAFIAALDLDVEGQTKVAEEMGSVPARGVPLAVDVVWLPDPLLEPDRWVRAPATTLVRDRATDRSYPPLPYVYTGSRFASFDQAVPGSGGVKRVERFMLGVTLSVVVNFDEPDALLASPFPLAAQDDLFEVNSALAPPEQSQIFFVFTRTTLPLDLVLAPDGALSHQGETVDDAALGRLLEAGYGAGAEPGLRAVGVSAPPAVDDAAVVACRERMIGLAAERGVWVVPVFTP